MPLRAAVSACKSAITGHAHVGIRLFTGQKVGSSSPTERAQVRGPFTRSGRGLSAALGSHGHTSAAEQRRATPRAWLDQCGSLVTRPGYMLGAFLGRAQRAVARRHVSASRRPGATRTSYLPDSSVNDLASCHSPDSVRKSSFPGPSSDPRTDSPVRVVRFIVLPLRAASSQGHD
jgi:hypothetical protein